MSQPLAAPPPPPSWSQTLGSLSMALYALLLLSIGGSALLCTGASVWGLIAGQTPAGVLLGSAKLDGLVLARLRAQGVLGENETPLLYHDHSPELDGRAGCMVVGQELLQWRDDQPVARLPIRGAQVQSQGDPEAPVVVLIQGAERVECPFDAGEGGPRLAELLTRSAAAP